VIEYEALSRLSCRGGSGVGVGRSSIGERALRGFGGFNGGFGAGHGFGGRQHFDRGYYHDHGHFGFFFGWPLVWYPYYWGPYYYSDYGYYYPPQYDYDYYYRYYPAPTYSYGDNAQSCAYPVYDRRDYLTLGHDSGKALRLQKVSREWLVDHLRAYIINASPSVRDDFRRGFISGYGEGAESVLPKAVQDARKPNPPPPHAGTAPKSESTPAEEPQ
jgi:hypothetical protein